jgi:hypothetical protein
MQTNIHGDGAPMGRVALENAREPSSEMICIVSARDVDSWTMMITLADDHVGYLKMTIIIMMKNKEKQIPRIKQ